MDLPKLRNIEPIPVEMENQTLIALRDPEFPSGDMIAITPIVFEIIRLLDGSHSLLDIQAWYMRRFGQILESEKIQEIIRLLDQHFLLDNQHFRTRQQEALTDYRTAPSRPALFAGESYPPEAGDLRAFLLEFYDGEKGPAGLPAESGSAARQPLAALVTPHIDFHRGGYGYAWAYRALHDAGPSDLYIILGIGHHAANGPYIGTGKPFATPFGLVPTAEDLVNRLDHACPFDLRSGELTHRTEHSIEFQVVYLRMLFPNHPFRILPLLCSSFLPYLTADCGPEDHPHIRGFLDAIRELIHQFDGTVTIIAGVDLSHIGLQFGRRYPVTESELDAIEQADRQFLIPVAEGDAGGIVRHMTDGGLDRNICGFPALFTLAALLPETHGRLLHYDRWFDPAAGAMVSFASLAFPG